jgi:PAS domain S-box-containing protein
MAKKPTFEELEQKIKELEIKLDAFKKIEKNWSIEKQFSESVIKSLPGIFYIFDEKGKFYRWNENSEKVTEYSTEEISKMSPFDFFEKKDKKMVADAIQEVFVKGRSNVEVNIVSKSGKKTPYFFSGAKTTIGNDSYLFGMGIDITERKQVEGALRESEEKYRHLSEGTFEAVVWYHKGKIIEANEQYYEMYGYKPEELAGKNAILLTATPDSVKFTKEQISLGHPGPYEVVGMKKDGTEFPIEIRAKMMKYKGQTARMAAIRDLTDCKRTEESLQKAHDELERRVKERTIALETKTKSLREINTTMEVLLKKRQQDKTDLENDVLTNAKNLIEPYLEKIKKTKPDNQQLALLSIIEYNLNEIVSPFTRKMSLNYLNLTPTEIQVANLLRHGSSSKEMAELMNLRPKTIYVHRKNIRKKLGMEDRRTNLRSHLLSLP